MADKRIINRILFFTPAGQVLDRSQRTKIIDYAEDRKTLHRPLGKFSFWQSVEICNNQNASNVLNTLSIEEVENPQHTKELVIRK